ncbi:NucA/NucB deoxyribonuclease domain-containing protein [Streptomyces sp. NPDC002845]
MTTMRHRPLPSIGLRSALISVLTALTLTAATGAASAKAPEADEPRPLATIDPADLPDSPLPIRTSTVPIPSGEQCDSTAPGSSERAAGAVRVCVTTSPKPATRTALAAAPTTTTAAAAADEEAAKATCTITSPGTFNYTRHDYCMTGLTVLYKLYNEKGTELGTGTLDVSTNTELPADGTAWDEHVTVRMTGATGQVTSLIVKFRSSCDSCNATQSTPWWGNRTLTVGQSASGDVSYSSSPAPETSVEFTTSYTLYVSTAGATPVDPTASWSNPRKIRCDDDVRDVTGGGTSPGPGCVFPHVRPAVEMSLAPYVQGDPGSGQGAAAATYLWAQNFLVDSWGRETPLTRAKYGAEERRARTCGDRSAKPFVHLRDIVPDDSCDEFPFAATYEGGTNGGLCAEVIPQWEDGVWRIYTVEGDPDPTPGMPCVRGHVPQPDNSSAGSKVRWAFEKERVLDGEKFLVNIA